jgi:hypothetical protein
VNLDIALQHLVKYKYVKGKGGEDRVEAMWKKRQDRERDKVGRRQDGRVRPEEARWEGGNTRKKGQYERKTMHGGPCKKRRQDRGGKVEEGKAGRRNTMREGARWEGKVERGTRWGKRGKVERKARRRGKEQSREGKKAERSKTKEGNMGKSKVEGEEGGREQEGDKVKKAIGEKSNTGAGTRWRR